MNVHFFFLLADLKQTWDARLRTFVTSYKGKSWLSHLKTQNKHCLRSRCWVTWISTFLSTPLSKRLCQKLCPTNYVNLPYQVYWWHLTWISVQALGQQRELFAKPSWLPELSGASVNSKHPSQGQEELAEYGTAIQEAHRDFLQGTSSSNRQGQQGLVMFRGLQKTLSFLFQDETLYWVSGCCFLSVNKYGKPSMCLIKTGKGWLWILSVKQICFTLSSSAWCISLFFRTGNNYIFVSINNFVYWLTGKDSFPSRSLAFRFQITTESFEDLLKG